MRYDGTLTTWNDDRGFGFLAPDQGGPAVFAHAKAFKGLGRRPAPGERFSFEVAVNREGKQRAARVQPLRSAAQRAVPVAPRGRGAKASLVAIPTFLAVYLAVATRWGVPAWVGAAYVIASALTYGLYALDKAAARAGRHRVPESVLLAIGLAGGWPGALLAQQRLRHKTVKAAFRRAFWLTVALNVIGFVLAFALGWAAMSGLAHGLPARG